MAIVWKRSMNPLLYYDSIYSLTSMKQHEDSYRQFIFEFIANEWNELLTDGSSTTSENSFIEQLFKVSAGGRHYSQDEVNDHVGTMLVAVSYATCLPSILILNCTFNNPRLEIRRAQL